MKTATGDLGPRPSTSFYGTTAKRAIEVSAFHQKSPEGDFVVLVVGDVAVELTQRQRGELAAFLLRPSE